MEGGVFMQEVDPGKYYNQQTDSTEADADTEGMVYEAAGASAEPPTFSLPESGGGWWDIPLGNE